MSQPYRTRVTVNDYRVKKKVGSTTPHMAKGEELPRGTDKGWDKDTAVGVIVHVNADTMSMDLILKGGAGVLTDVPITSAYVGPAGFMGVCPEIGCLVVLKKTEAGPIPITYMIPQPEFALQYDLLEMFPKEVSDFALEQGRVIPAKYRRLRPGEARLASSMGSELMLDEDAELADSMDNSIRVRAGDGSVIATSLQNYMFTNGVWRSAGPIQRNSLDFKVLGEPESEYEATEVVHSDGTKSVYIGGDYGYLSSVYNEYRVEVEDQNTIGKQINDVNEGLAVTVRRPKTVFLLGNMVGNDTADHATYGKFLSPSFISERRGDGHLNFKALVPNGDGDVLGSQGVAWGFQIPGKHFIGADKEGSLHAYLGATRGDNPGISMQLVARGGRVEEWGVIREGQVSWDLFCRGGLRWTIGKMTDSPERDLLPRSSEVRYLGGTYTEHGYDSSASATILKGMKGEDLPSYKVNQYKRVERVAGKSRTEVSGDNEVVVGGSSNEQTSGSKTLGVGGAYGESSIGDRTISTAGSFSVNAMTEMKVLAPKRTEKFVKGSDSKQILLGDDSTEIAVGNQTTKVLTGGVKRTVVAGSMEDMITAGNHSTSILAGNHTVSVTAGNISLSTTAGNVSIGGTLVSVTGMASVDISAPFVGLGNQATRSGVITFLSHRDYVTGAPLIPSFTVMAGL